MMRILFLTRYHADGASSRYRTLQYIPYLRNRGFQCDVSPLFPVGYVHKRFDRIASLPLPVLRGYWSRLSALWKSKKYDLLVIEKECLPFAPAGLELGLLRGDVPFIFDLDDPLYHTYDGTRGKLIQHVVGDKFPDLFSRASAVIAGSHYIADYAKRFCQAVYLVPTAIDLSRYPAEAQARSSNSLFTIGWIGSKGQTKHLKLVEGVLAKYCVDNRAKLHIIGGSRATLRIPNLEFRDWSSETEIDELAQIDVGIMPLFDDSMSRGKCAFKLIQYMASWKPVVASPIGENTYVVEPRQNGFLASNEQEWRDALDVIRENISLAHSMGASGRKKVEESYCISATLANIRIHFS